jgi:hypothetical protein
VLRPVRRDGDVRHRRVELLWTRHDAAMLSSNPWLGYFGPIL